MSPTEVSSIATTRWVRLRPTVFAPRIARRFVCALGDPAGLPQALVDDAAFVVGHLVTESIRQSRRDIEVGVQMTGQQITVRVRSADASALLLRDDAEYTPARNSATVRHLAESWGCCRYQRGWEVWAVLRPSQTEFARAI